MRILYLHDFGKDPNQVLLTSLKSDFEVIAPLMKPEEIIDEAFVERIIADQLGDRFIIMGEGLGAYWANYFASKLELFSVLINPCFNPKADYNIQTEPIAGLGHSAQTYVLIDRANKATSIDTVDTLFDHKAYVEAYSDQKELISILKNKALKELSYHARTYQTYLGLGLLNFHKDMEAWDRDRFTLPHLVRQILEDENPLKGLLNSAKRCEIYDHVAKQLFYETSAKWNSLNTCIQANFSYWLEYKLDDSVVESLGKKILEQTPQYFEEESYDESEQFIGDFNYYGYAIGPIKQAQNAYCELSEQQVSALKQLNDRLATFEKEVLEEAINLELKIKQHAAETGKTINHYSLTFNLSVRMAVENKRQNNWLLFTEDLGSGCSENKKAFLKRLTIDHNKLPSKHPLNRFKHSWLFHQLYAVWNVSFNDLLQVNSMNGQIDAVFYTPFLDFT